MNRYEGSYEDREYGPGIRREYHYAIPEPTKKKKKWGKKGLALLIALALILSGTLGFAGGLVATSMSQNLTLPQTFTQLLPQRATSEGSETGFNLEKATGSEMTIQEIIHQAANAVVEIRTEAVATDFWLGQYVTQGAGSGVIVASEGVIITNNHVIEGAQKITVTLKNGESYEARLIGTDPQTDVAVIQIDETGLTAARIGDSSQLVVGDLAVAIGNPLGELGGTATAGIISALDREVTIEGKAMSLLQTDASINPGNSGGGLFNQYGQLIGVVVAKSGGSNVEGLGFAIPINTAKAVADQLLEHGYVQGRVQMGLTLVDIATSYDATRYGVKALGVYVVSADTAQSKSAGFISGDRLISIDDAVINQFSDVPKALEKYEVGDTVKVTVARENQTRVLTLVLGEKRS
ncbi:MAG: trypsin-like peptidase domain-containing protein [Anaerovoracaceae bacterium]